MLRKPSKYFHIRDAIRAGNLRIRSIGEWIERHRKIQPPRYHEEIDRS